MRRSLILLFLLSAVPMLPAQQKPASATIQLPPKPLLPQSFAGWTATAAPVESTKAGNFYFTEGTHPTGTPSLLDEDGFKRESTADYRKASGTIHLDVMQFADATGAYAAFTQYDLLPKPGVALQQTYLPALAMGGVLSDGRIKFWQGDTLVTVNWQGTEPKGLSADLTELTKALPLPTGSKAQPPALPGYLPKAGLNNARVYYALGPEGLMSTGSLSGKLDFNTGAEVVIGTYGSGTLTLVEYPTPQMAAAQLKTFAAQFNLQPQKSLPDGLLSNSQNVAWRTGPIVALTDNMAQAEAIKLAHAVHYEAEITLNKPQGYVSEAWRAAHLYLGIAALAGILCAASVILGLFFGGARAIIRVLRGKSASAVEDTEFISLNLAHGPVHPDGRQD